MSAPCLSCVAPVCAAAHRIANQKALTGTDIEVPAILLNWDADLGGHTLQAASGALVLHTIGARVRPRTSSIANLRDHPSVLGLHARPLLRSALPQTARRRRDDVDPLHRLGCGPVSPGRAAALSDSHQWVTGARERIRVPTNAPASPKPGQRWGRSCPPSRASPRQPYPTPAVTNWKIAAGSAPSAIDGTAQVAGADRIESEITAHADRTSRKVIGASSKFSSRLALRDQHQDRGADIASHEDADEGGGERKAVLERKDLGGIGGAEKLCHGRFPLLIGFPSDQTKECSYRLQPDVRWRT